MSSFRSYNNNKVEHNLSDEQFNALLNLSENLDIVIQKSDKGNSVVLVDKTAYITRVKTLLSNSDKFKTLNIEQGKQLNYVISQEIRLKAIFKSLLDKGRITKDVYFKLYPWGSRPGILYGLPKVHKPCIDNCPAYRPILSAIGTPSYKLAKFLVPILSSITSNEYTTKDSFSFAKEIVSQDSKLFMASLDVDSLFTNIPLVETVNICVDSLFENCEKVQGLSKENFTNFSR